MKTTSVKMQWEVLGERVFAIARKACQRFGRYDEDAMCDTLATAYKYHLLVARADSTISNVIYMSAKQVCLDEAAKLRPELLGQEDVELLAAPYDDGRTPLDTSRLEQCTRRMPTVLGETALAIGTSEDCSNAANSLRVSKGCVSKRVKRMRALPTVTDLAVRHYGPYRALAVFVA